MMHKSAVLVVSFGTSYNETRTKTIEAIENTIQGAYPGYEVRRAFTSPTIINKLAKRDGLIVNNVTEALECLLSDGFEKIAVQPTYILSGFEYDGMLEAIKPFEAKFANISCGLPLLSSDEDYENVLKTLIYETYNYSNCRTAIVFMGHGTKHKANNIYRKLDNLLKEKGFWNYFIGTVEGEPTIDCVMTEIQAIGSTRIKKVVLLPLMIVAGDHALNDMVGGEKNSWKNIFKSRGYEVECVLRGLGEYKGIRDIFAAHAGLTISTLVQNE